MPLYSEINWEDANCRGVETEVFYRIEEIRRPDPEIYVKPLRALCAACPIWKECLSYASLHEFYGWWGGMETLERQAFTEPNKMAIRQKMYQEFAVYGITKKMIDEALGVE